jgi:maltose/moltooligosaccharide transporter
MSAASAASMPGAATINGSATRPALTFWQIWNMCFGFLGIQFAFALQNGNVSSIFQTLGAEIDDIAILWIAAPLTGLIVQPLVGYYSDRTWNWLGRRRPYFLAGAILSSLALVAMPHSAELWMAAVLLWVLDASINVSMEPFRAFVADQLPERQRPAGYAMQTFFIGVGAVIASLLPYFLERAGVSNVGTGTGSESIPDTVRYSFFAGAAVLLVALSWTVLRTREYPPTELHRFTDATPERETVEPGRAARARLRGALWSIAGAAGAAAVWWFALEKELYILTLGSAAWGLALLLFSGRPTTWLLPSLVRDIDHMPARMRELVPVQFFSWVALFCMWIYAVPAVAQEFFGSTDAKSAAYGEGRIWVNVLFGVYNGVAAVAAMIIPFMARRFGLQVSHLINLLLGAAGLLSFALVRDPDWLLVSMIGVGFAWGSILALPYALLAGSVPSRKMGVYMGIFNFFIVIPQLVAVSTLGALLQDVFDGRPLYVLVLGGLCFLIAGVLALRVR